MLRRLKELIGFNITAIDDKIGKVHDFYFEDDSWHIRYMIVDTGPWILGKQVLISPAAIEVVNWDAGTVAVQLTKEQIEESPDIGLDLPVSRQHEIQLHQHYGWPAYWLPAPAIATPMGGYAVPVPMQAVPTGAAAATQVENDYDSVPEEQTGDPNLRSLNEVINYDIHATDGYIGHVEDFFAAENDWRIRYMLVDTRNWLPGRHVLLDIDWANRIDWTDRDVFVDITREQVESSPEYDPQTPITRSYEETLYTNYQMPGYWF
ncbi:MAG: PRC-barrel domain-containing protein [Caldilineaceae bacterium]|nr:PRC-barrel domain-containing protein [Caldilineaceae bacterium]